jgi:hypothetical protein
MEREERMSDFWSFSQFNPWQPHLFSYCFNYG